MKTSKLISCIPSILGMITLATSPVHAGIIDILRGEKTEPAVHHQRVAFVGAAEVKEVGGVVERLAGIEHWVPLEEGRALTPGDLVRTGEGMAVLRMTESGSYVKLTPRTVLRLVPLKEEWKDPGILSGQEERDGYKVRACRGKAFYKVAEGNWRPVNVNDVLPQGSVVRTGEGAVLDLFHVRRSQAFRVLPESELGLDGAAMAGRVVPVKVRSLASVGGH